MNRTDAAALGEQTIFGCKAVLGVVFICLLLVSCAAIDRIGGDSYGGSGEDAENRRRAAATCRDYADRQRLNVLRTVSSRPLGAGNDYEVHLSVLSRGGIEDVTCYTDVRTGSTRIAN
jgi:hypothetical protein